MSHSIAIRWSAGVTLAMLLLSGCMKVPEPPPAAEKKPEKSGSILKQTTQEIGRYDPAAGREVSDSKVRATNPITGPLEAYGPLVEQISKTNIDYWLTAYHAEHGRWPDYDEFMAEIIKRHDIRLPVLPGKMEYQYDEENHKLVVVHPEEEDD